VILIRYAAHDPAAARQLKYQPVAHQAAYGVDTGRTVGMKEVADLVRQRAGRNYLSESEQGYSN
jgi:hypothetical protein